MKIGIIGAGGVGAACLLAGVLRGSAREFVLLDRAAKRARAVAEDVAYGAPVGAPVRVGHGDYPDFAGCDLVMITAGINEKAGGATDRSDPEGRLRLIDKNAAVFRDIVPRVVGVAPEAVLLVVTDPPDPLADLARDLAPQSRVVSTGTWLDSMRLRTHVARRLRVDPASVEALVLGEHGTSEVFVWSGVTIGGVPLPQVLRARGEDAGGFREAIEKEVRYANIAIIEGNNASQYGIGMVCARIAEAVLRDERIVVPVGAYRAEHGVTLSLPSVLGARGVEDGLSLALPEAEQALLDKSIAALRTARQRALAG